MISSTKDGRDYSAVIDNARISRDADGNISETGDNVRSQGVGGHNTTDDNAKKSTDGKQVTHLGDGIKYNNALQTIMGQRAYDQENTAWAAEFIYMKCKVNSGEMSEGEYKAKLTEFVSSASKDLTPLYNKQTYNQNSTGIDAHVKADFEVAGSGAGIKYSTGIQCGDKFLQDEVTRHLVECIDSSVTKHQQLADEGSILSISAQMGVVKDLQTDINSMMNVDLTTSTGEFISKKLKD